MPTYPWTAKHFTPEEFACKDNCGLCNPDPKLVEDLDEFRERYGEPVIITSGSRCAAHCVAIGDNIPPYRNVHQPAADGFTKAVDIACESDRMRFSLVEFFMCFQDYRRIEVTNKHVHVDLGAGKDIAQDVFIWNKV